MTERMHSLRLRALCTLDHCLSLPHVEWDHDACWTHKNSNKGGLFQLDYMLVSEHVHGKNKSFKFQGEGERREGRGALQCFQGSSCVVLCVCGWLVTEKSDGKSDPRKCFKRVFQQNDLTSSF